MTDLYPYKLTLTDSAVGTCSITVTVISNDPNYYGIDVTHRTSDRTNTVTATDLAVQNLAFAKASLDKTYGDAPFINTLTGVASGSTVLYSSSDNAIASVGSDGKVAIHKVGQVTITASASATKSIRKPSGTAG